MPGVVLHPFLHFVSNGKIKDIGKGIREKRLHFAARLDPFCWEDHFSSNVMFVMASPNILLPRTLPVKI